MDWAAYLRGANRVEFADPCAHRKYMTIADSLTKACAFNFGDLRYKNVAKQIVKERTQPIAVRKGYASWSFRFQCLLTGRKSKFIKIEDYYLFGITKSDMIDGGHYSEVADIADKMHPVRERLMLQLTALRDNAFATKSAGDWWLRYSEYLRSEEWFSIREAVLHRDGGKCMITGDTRELQIHHLTYRNVGSEQLGDLVTLCKDAHSVVHDTKHAMHARYTAKLQSITEAA